MSPWIPTHTITVRLHGREPEITHVMLCDGDGPGFGPAYTREEWDSDSAADWELTTDGWRCMGEVTPGGCPGSVTVERIITDRAHAAELMESGEISSFFEIVDEDGDPHRCGYEGNAFVTHEAAEAAIVDLRTLADEWNGWGAVEWRVREVWP